MKYILYYVIFLSLQVQAVDYEECDWRNQEASPFENASPSTNEFLNHLHSRRSIPVLNNKCFLTSTKKIFSKGSQDQFIHCEKRNNQWIKTNLSVTKCIHQDQKTKTCEKKLIYPRRPCLDKTYITNTNLIFHDMTKCFELPIRETFILLNHESGFISNVRSFTGARCYGQMTVSGIGTVNTQIQKNHPIYTQFTKTCPTYNTDDLIFPTPKTKGQIYQMDCELTKNPFSCMFYSAFLVKFLKTKIHHMLNTYHKKHNRFEWIESELGISLPIKLNEIVIVSDYRKAKPRFYIFKNEEELHSNKNKNLLHTYRTLKTDSQIYIKKIPLFQNRTPDQLEWILTYWSYNGGGLVSTKYFPEYMTHLKHNISIPCSKSIYRFCSKRTQILNNFKNNEYGLDLIEDFIDNFSSYLNQNYRNHRNRSEVASFIHNLIRSMKPIFAEDTCNF